MMKSILATIFFLQCSTCLAADYQTCLQKSEGIDPKMRDCQAVETERQNDALNRVYQSILSKLQTKPDAAGAVKNAERAWIKFRDANCDVVDAVFGGGSLDRMKHGDCVIDMTKTRIAELTSLDKTPDLGAQ